MSLKSSWILCYLIAGILPGFCLYAGSPKSASPDCSSEERYPMIEKSELKSLVADKKVFVVDVNGKDSFSKHHVPGAIHFGTTAKQFAQLLPKDKDALIVAYCGGPQCTAWKKAAEEACKLGYTHIKHFKAGIKGWVEGET